MTMRALRTSHRCTTASARAVALLCLLSFGAAAAQAEKGSGVLTAPVLLAQPVAPYTAEAAAAGIEGAVKLRVTLDEEGRVTLAEVTEGLGYGLDEAAVKGLMEARFSPATLDGKAVACVFEFVLHFVAPRPAVLVEEGASSRSEPAPESAPAPAEADRFTTTVRGSGSTARALVRGSEAVNVVRLERAQERAEDLGEVLTRNSAVQVQRTGGMGSRTQLSLGGLSGDQVRVLLDGAPIEYSPYVFGLGSVPVSLVQQLEVFNGVVPVRLATDALGGAIHLRSELAPARTGTSLSLQGGSFDTLRGTARVTWRAHERLFVRATGFHDRAENDYLVTVPVDDPVTGRVSQAQVARGHDAYRASGGSLEVGLESLPGIDRLVLQAYLGRYDKEVPHDSFMIRPYGGVTSAQDSRGLGLRWETTAHERLKVLALAGYNRRRGELLDVSDCLYDWYGECRAQQARGGEIGAFPLENTQLRQTGFGRVRLLGTVFDAEDLELSLGADHNTRRGENAYLTRLEQEDPLRVPLSLTSLFGGVSHRQRLWSDRLENTVFAKGYFQRFASGTGSVGDGSASDARWAGGFGDTVRLSVTRRLLLKASYERTTRMPRVDELFGDGGLLLENRALVPETSHNGNAGVELLPVTTRAGVFGANAMVGVREVRNLIQLFPADATQAYANVDRARSRMAHAGLDWTSPGEWVGLGGTVTWLDFRNLAEEGQFARFHGDRMPNMPWLQSSATARLQWKGVVSASDALVLEWTTRYVEAFYRSWESAGRQSSKAQVPSQLLHSTALTWRARTEAWGWSASLNLNNVTDADAYDVVGVQKPGRALFARVTVEL